MKRIENIGQSLFPKVKRQILTLLLTNPERQWTISQVIQLTGNSSGAVQRELKRLVGAGILRQERDGRRKLYSANTGCMIFPELRQIVIKTFGVTDNLRERLEPLREKLDVAFIYGSVASGEDTGDSDIDVMAVGEVTLRELVSALGKSEEIIKRVINPTVYSAQEFRSQSAHSNHFILNVLKSPKLFLVGDQDDFEGLAR